MKNIYFIACMMLGATAFSQHGMAVAETVEMADDAKKVEESAPEATDSNASMAQTLYENVAVVGGDGTPSTVKALAQGKPVLVVAFAPWCGWCVKEIPGLNALQAKMGDKLVIAVVSADKASADTIVEQGKSMEGNTVPFYYSPDLGQFMSQNGFHGIPAAFLFHQNGSLVMVENQYTQWDSAEKIEEIEKKLNMGARE